ncbi:DUF234 domain-containing protein [Microbacterium sp. HD4P20]|uniref:ATP-binding protein n=1 Tax=Microbacterium sp. HD4P20 TaxID=2864874 RepID=UPI0020A415EC|nr:DUF234 domain-containing protein [Microbacterium sp. HD4P20]MCP2638098.1 DUF234 domain-containing protein [Microbacterium sp. HD4P20]
MAETWREWLGQVALAATEGPVVVVLDEFPWMAGGDASSLANLEGILQSSWDRTLSKLPVLLILIGSDIAVMEQLGQHDRPLYGRFQPLVVPSLNPGEVAQGMAGAASIDVWDAYLLTGGYPRLLSSLAMTGDTPAQWARRSLSDATAPWVVTARLAFDAEIADSAAAYRVLSSLGAAERGELNLGSVAAKTSTTGVATKTEQTAALRALHHLREKGLIDVDEPAWATSSRLRRYRVADTYLRVWFRYVEKHQGVIARGRGDIAANAFDRDWPTFRGILVEPAVREALLRIARTDARLAGTEDVRPWWTRDGQKEVDAVGMGRYRSTFIGTIKWRVSRGVTENDVRALIAADTPRADDAAVVAVCPSGEVPSSAVGFSAADLLTAWS